MKLNQSVYYAIACLIELSYRTGEYVDADHIAVSQNIPPAYKHKVLQALSQVGLVFSLKGSGYRLARPLTTINVLDVVQALNKDQREPATNLHFASVLEKKIDHSLELMTLAELNGKAGGSK